MFVYVCACAREYVCTCVVALVAVRALDWRQYTLSHFGPQALTLTSVVAAAGGHIAYRTEIGFARALCACKHSTPGELATACARDTREGGNRKGADRGQAFSQ